MHTMHTIYKSVVLLLTAVTISAFYQCNQYYYLNNNFQARFSGCQEYETQITGERMEYRCKSYTDKIGSCPTNTSEFDLPPYAYEAVKCVGDWFCPPGYKCCKESSARNINICKKAILEAPKVNQEERKDSGVPAQRRRGRKRPKPVTQLPPSA